MRLALWPDSTSDEVDGLVARRDDPDHRVLVAEAGRSAVGTAHVPLCGFAEVGTRPWAEGCESSPVAYLEGIWVDPPSRRSGVATALVDAALTWARKKGLTELASDTRPANAASRALHRSAGFQEVEQIVCLRRPVDPTPHPGSGS